jgi:hypothetical protein
MADPIVNTSIDSLTQQAFQGLVSKGIYALLFPLKTDEGELVIDTTTNLLADYPVGGFSTSGDSADSEEFQSQLAGGVNKTFLAGAIDPGDISFNTYFAPNKSKPNVAGVVNSTVTSPQFILILAIQHTTATLLQGFFAAGVNYAGGNDIKGDYGKTMGSSMKFKITGTSKWGFTEVGTFPKTLYTGSGE